MSRDKIEKRVAYDIARSLYPGVAKIEIDFSGMGDSFDHFSEFRLYDQDLQEIGGPNRGLDPTSNHILHDYFFDVLNLSQYVTFNDQGSFGTITMDLDNVVTRLDCVWYGGEEYDEETEKPTEYF